jgi:hypothetical protein
MSNAKAKTRPGGDQRNLPNKGRNLLQTRFGVASLFQPRKLLDSGAGDEKTDNASLAAVIEQIGFDGRRYGRTVLLPLNSDIWRKLPNERENSERPDE